MQSTNNIFVDNKPVFSKKYPYENQLILDQAISII